MTRQYLKGQFKVNQTGKKLYMNVNTERIKLDYLMMKNYVDSNPPKSLLDLFTIKQVKRSHRLGWAPLKSPLEYGSDGNATDWNHCLCTATLQIQPTSHFLTFWPFSFIMCIIQHMHAPALLPCWQVIQSLEAERSDRAVTSSCFSLCHRGSVSLLSTWGSSARHTSLLFTVTWMCNKYWQMVQKNMLQPGRERFV